MDTPGALADKPPVAQEFDNFDDEADWRGRELQPPFELVRFQPSSL
jgi:hypothetical protein